MNSFKAFLREKGLYLLCLALVLIATVTGVMAVQTVVRNVKSLTDARQKALEEQTWNQPDALANSPTEDLPIATPMPSPSAAPSPEPSAAPWRCWQVCRSVGAVGRAAGLVWHAAARFQRG